MWSVGGEFLNEPFLHYSLKFLLVTNLSGGIGGGASPASWYLLWFLNETSVFQHSVGFDMFNK